MRRKISIFIVIACCLCIYSSTAQVRNIGAITSYKKIPGGIEGKTLSTIFDLHIYNDNIIRIRVSKNKSFRNFSYALVDNNIPSFSQIDIKENGSSIFISTKMIHVEIDKSPSFRIIFRDNKDQIISEDAKGDAFGTTFIGNKINLYKNLQQGERFVGLGEALGNLDRRGTGVTLNNTDNYKYGDPRVPMYISVPFYIGVHHQLSYGIFYNNSYKSFFNFGMSTPELMSVSFDGGDVDYFFMYDESISKIIEHYTTLTGRMQLPPKWAIGYHQSRCTYYPQEKVEWIAETFRKKKIPLDCIVLDADYQLGYEPFRTNTKRFPDLPGLARDLANMNIELTASVYPGVHIDSTYESYTDGLNKDVFIKNADGSNFETEIPPLRCYLPDYTNPKTRSWWIDKMKWMRQNGINGYWNDMNEPAVTGSYLPDNLVFDFDGHRSNALEAKNLYGFQMARSSFEAAAKYDDKRPFVLTRSGFAGVQRYSGVWSGDNTANDEGLLTGVLLNSQLGLSGIAFSGYDIGGYIGDGSKDLYKRWIEAGVFSPFCRNHREFLGAANEPWAYGEEAEAISKTFIDFRYRMLPYMYAAFYEASRTGLPVVKSLCLDYPFDDKVYDRSYQYQFLFGNDVMVAPVTSQEKTRKIYLPEGAWYNIYTDEKVTGQKERVEETPTYQIPIYIKASAIIAVQSTTQSTKEKPTDTLQIHIYNGTKNNSFVYYEDAGDGMEYKKNQFCKRAITFSPADRKLMIAKQEGAFNSVFKNIQLVFHGFGDELKAISVNHDTNKRISVFNVKLLDALENLSDIYDANYFKSLRDAVPDGKLKSVVFENSTNEVLIEW